MELVLHRALMAYEGGKGREASGRREQSGRWRCGTGRGEVLEVGEDPDLRGLPGGEGERGGGCDGPGGCAGPGKRWAECRKKKRRERREMWAGPEKGEEEKEGKFSLFFFNPNII